MLRPLSDNGQGPLPPTRVCESCGTVVQIGHDAINCIIVIGSPGHPSLSPFQCGQEEHWACSIDCWQKIAHACVDEHMVPLLNNKHARLTESYG